MQLHNLKKNKSNRKAKQVGRGGTRGKTAGRGTKGQNARSGRKKRPEMRDIIKRLPKLRGRGKNFLKTRKSKPVVLSTEVIDKSFGAGELVNPSSLFEKGLVSKARNKIPRIKILGGKKFSKKLSLEGVSVSGKTKKINE